ncbi:hypothetical protein Ancab_005462 [Ancistrocladus abbreviatus]
MDVSRRGHPLTTAIKHAAMVIAEEATSVPSTVEYEVRHPPLRPKLKPSTAESHRGSSSLGLLDTITWRLVLLDWYLFLLVVLSPSNCNRLVS